MLPFKEAFLRHLEASQIKFTDFDEETVKIGYRTKTIEHMDLYVIFDKTGKNYVTIYSWSIGAFPEDSKNRAILTCNDMNAHYRWVKFFVDSKGKVCVQIDAVLDMSNVGPEVLELVRRTVNIVEEAYPVFMKARWV